MKPYVSGGKLTNSFSNQCYLKYHNLIKKNLERKTSPFGKVRNAPAKFLCTLYKYCYALIKK